MSIHAFVAMPFGTRDGVPFDDVYRLLIKPALEAAEFKVFRADEAKYAGEIRRDMFNELLLADLVVVDISVDNPNVWYELGIRHGLRKRGVVLLNCKRDRPPFDVATERMFSYGLDDLRKERISKKRKAFRDFTRATMDAWHGHTVSPVYQMLPALREPNWRDAAMEGSQEFGALFKSWQQRVEVAQRKNRPGDILLLARETPTWVLKLETRVTAAKALAKTGQFAFALKQIERALEIRPTDLEARRERALLLGHLGRHVEARALVERLREETRHTRDADTACLLGQILEGEWVRRWHSDGQSAEDARALAAHERQLHADAQEGYMRAFVLDSRHVVSGVGALRMQRLRAHLHGDGDGPAEAVDGRLQAGVSWACWAALQNRPEDFETRMPAAEFALLTADTAEVERAFRGAVVAADRDWFGLHQARTRLETLAALAFRPAQVAAAVAIVDQEMRRSAPPRKPRRVFVFYGPLMQRAGRPDPGAAQLAPDQLAAARCAITAKLDQLSADEYDLAICGGACGGDLLFAEICTERLMPVHLYLPYEEPEFLEKRVQYAGLDWVERYYRVAGSAGTTLRFMPDEVGHGRGVDEPPERNRRWEALSALSYGPENVHFISLELDGPEAARSKAGYARTRVEKYGGRIHAISLTAPPLPDPLEPVGEPAATQ